MKDLIIVGAGGFGREVYAWAKQCSEYGVEWSIKGFLDDRKDALDPYDYPVGIVGGIEGYKPAPNDVFVCALGLIAPKKSVCTSLLERGATFITLIHPTAVIGDHVQIGEGSVICPYVILTCDIHLGKFVTVNCHTSIGHDVEVGDWCTLSCHCDVTGFCKVGEGVYFGSHVSLIPNRKIGPYATLGAGSVVINTIKEQSSVFGVPAKRFK
ncbi:MAG TPA: hypothetical protein DIU37_06105 [Opitutae bacterium]|nr:hypothetical protein [Opitutae bacterium]|tara:strand:- start:8 stop:640 length:633 start_codon:yes stop_codon:yes gene_type:complete